MSVGKTLDMVGVGFDEVAIGKNTLMDSALSPYTPDQLANLNHQADVIYDDFLHKVAAGRKLPFAQVQDIARGRVWTGADAKTHGLVDELGGFWTAADLAGQLGGVPKDQLVFKIYPRRRGLIEGLTNLMGGADVGLRLVGSLQTLMDLPGIQGVLRAVSEAPRGVWRCGLWGCRRTSKVPLLILSRYIISPVRILGWRFGGKPAKL